MIYSVIYDNCDLVSSLCGDDNVELVGSVDWCRETTGHRVIRVANIGDDTVKDDRCLCVVFDRSDVVCQSDKKSNTSLFLR